MNTTAQEIGPADCIMRPGMRPHTYHQFYATMEGSWRARELLEAYRKLETLYSVRMGYWLVWWMNSAIRRKYRAADLKCINQRYLIQDLGGKVPSFWSLA